MNDASTLIVAALAIPAAAAALIPVFRSAPAVRDLITLIAGVVTLIVVVQLVLAVGAASQSGAAYPAFELIRVAPGLAIRFEVEPLGAVFALLASSLWIVNSLYSIGYMRGNHEKDQTRFFACFAIAIAAALGVAMAADLFTLFVAYEVLTLSTYPLVAHKGDAKARRGARIYLTILLSTSIGLLLPAILATFAVAGTTTFTAGGLFPATASPMVLNVILVLFAFGVGKAALMPVHGWLPNAMVAPTPVSALLHAVAVVKAGVFTMLKLALYVFGPETLRGLAAADALAVVAAVSIVLASLIAITKDNLKARLAFSTVSQLSYVTLGAMLATPAALLGAALQLVMHAVGKITLFMTAGAIYTGAHKTEISTMVGLGRVMPWTFIAYTVGAVSIIGLPPLAGMWPKLFLMEGAVDADRRWLVFALAISSVLNVAYLLPLAVRGLFKPPVKTADDAHGAPRLTVIAPLITAAACVAMFFLAGVLGDYLAPALEAANGGR